MGLCCLRNENLAGGLEKIFGANCWESKMLSSNVTDQHAWRHLCVCVSPQSMVDEAGEPQLMDANPTPCKC